MNRELLGLVIQLIAGSITGFMGILLWSKTRDAAWLFIITASILFYGGIVYDALVFFGALNQLPLGPDGRFFSEIVLKNLPYLFLSLGFGASVRRKSR